MQDEDDHGLATGGPDLDGPRRKPERHVCEGTPRPPRPRVTAASPKSDLAAEYERRFGLDLPLEQAAARMRQELLKDQPRRSARPTLASLRRQGIGPQTARVIRRYRSARLTAAMPPARSRECRAAAPRRRGSRRGAATGSRAGPDSDAGEPEPPSGRLQHDLAPHGAEGSR